MRHFRRGQYLRNYFLHKLVVLNVFILHKLVAFSHDESFESLFKHIKCVWAFFEEAKHQLNILELILLYHLDQTGVFHVQQSLGVYLDIFFQEFVNYFVHAGRVQIRIDTVLLLHEPHIRFDQVCVA